MGKQNVYYYSLRTTVLQEISAKQEIAKNDFLQKGKMQEKDQRFLAKLLISKKSRVARNGAQEIGKKLKLQEMFARNEHYFLQKRCYFLQICVQCAQASKSQSTQSSIPYNFKRKEPIGVQ